MPSLLIFSSLLTTLPLLVFNFCITLLPYNFLVSNRNTPFPGHFDVFRFGLYLHPSCSECVNWFNLTSLLNIHCLMSDGPGACTTTGSIMEFGLKLLLFVEQRFAVVTMLPIKPLKLIFQFF